MESKQETILKQSEPTEVRTGCILCEKDNPIIWHDWEKGAGDIDLCYDCYIWIFPEDKDKIIDCKKCKNKFIPKFHWQETCSNCWRTKKYGK